MKILISEIKSPLTNESATMPAGVNIYSPAYSINQPTHKRMEGADEKKEVLSERIKAVIGAMLEGEELPVTNISVHIAEKMHLNYSYLSDIFSNMNGITIEHYIISKKIEKATELLSNTDIEIGKISQRLNYKSCTHFSAQFRVVTGYRPSAFRRMVKNTGKGDIS